MSFVCNGDTPHFGLAEIEQIYQLAPTKTTDCLRDTARTLFPDRDPVLYENLILQKGHGRAFLHNGNYELPKWNILAYPEMFGVMVDDTIYPFCDSQFYRRTET